MSTKKAKPKSKPKAKPKARKTTKQKKAKPVRSWGIKDVNGELTVWADPKRHAAEDNVLTDDTCVRVIVSEEKPKPKAPKTTKQKKAEPVRSWGIKTADGKLTGWADYDKNAAEDEATTWGYRCVRVVVSEA